MNEDSTYRAVRGACLRRLRLAHPPNGTRLAQAAVRR
jgi:hypothetical protein